MYFWKIKHLRILKSWNFWKSEIFEIFWFFDFRKFRNFQIFSKKTLNNIFVSLTKYVLLWIFCVTRYGYQASKSKLSTIPEQVNRQRHGTSWSHTKKHFFSHYHQNPGISWTSSPDALYSNLVGRGGVFADFG